MARTPGLVIITAILAAVTLNGANATEPSPSPSPSETPAPAKAKANRFNDEKFQKNLKRWKSLSPERQAELRKIEEARRKRILKEINEAIAQSGLNLDEEQRQMFIYRYAQERKSIEETLRQELERKRAAAVDRLMNELVKEFQEKQPEAKPEPVTSE